ncbi:ATP-binding cassette domain-containing protein [Streptomyces sp. YIM 130001]|uniref:ATP-binding cassette domain-containing protein n=1 Tax=Streptomyces sp. YIM 130001 TaxID=2259644 RepID=UPI000E65804C|nr:ATP-binding cassette domain-containing protein [Streptomyces sp. YIM 130001]
MKADGFGLEGPRGWAFRGISIDAEPGSVIALQGPSGSGRTSLLLALTGRMRPTEGTAAVGRMALPRRMAAVRRFTALGPVPGVTDLEPALTVHEQLRERALLQRRFGGSVRELFTAELFTARSRRSTAVRDRQEAALAAVGLDLDTLPKGPRTPVRDLERLEVLRLSLALALIGEPRLVGVDDLDLKLSDAEREAAWELLGSIAADGTTVLAVCSESPAGAVRVDTAPPSATRDSARTAASTPSAIPGSPETSKKTENTENTETEEGAADAFAETGRA